jgi:hypothetical protein
MALILDGASGAAPTATMQEWMRSSWKSIVADPSFQNFLPESFTEPIHSWVDFVIEQGGTPLRALWVTTAILFPQIWAVVSEGAPPYPILRQQMIAFIFGKSGFNNPSDYLLSVNCAFRVHVSSPLPAGPSIAFTPKSRLRVPVHQVEFDPDLEKTVKTKHHVQLHLRVVDEDDPEEQLRITHKVSENIRHIEFINALLALVTRCWCHSFVAASSPQG